MSTVAMRCTEDPVVSRTDIVAAAWTTAGDAVPLEGREVSPVPLSERITAAAAAGFTGFGIVHHDLAPYLESGGDLATLRYQLDDHGMRHVELEFLTGWWLPAESRAAPDATLRLLVEAAEVLGARNVKIGPDIEGGPLDLDRYAAELYRVAEAFAPAGAVACLEFMPFSNVPTLAVGAELVRRAGHRNAGLMVDIWHLVRGGISLDELAAVPLELITGVELDDGDAQQVGSGYEDTVLRRKLCGQGDFPVVPFAETLAEMGWGGPWGLEVISEDYRRRPLREALADAYSTTARCLERAGIQMPEPHHQSDMARSYFDPPLARADDSGGASTPPRKLHQ